MGAPQIDTLAPSGSSHGGPPAKDVLQTYTGLVLRPLDPWPGDFRIEDIAWSLAHQCRYNGHTKMFYSVATHSLLVSYFLPPRLRLEGLLHDASEAYLSDLPSPIKQAMPEYQKVEYALELALASQFCLAMPNPAVKQADDLVFQLECALVMGGEIARKFALQTPDRSFVEHEIITASERSPRSEAEHFTLVYQNIQKTRGRDLQGFE
jgi:hypothetical protein